MRFRERVAIQQPTRTQDAAGAVIETWTNVPGLESVPATIVMATRMRASGEQRDPQKVWVEDQFDVILAGFWPSITTLMRVVADDGREFDITSVAPTLGRRRTVIQSKIVTPRSEAA